MTANEVRIFFLFLFLLGPGDPGQPPRGGPKYEPFALNGSCSVESMNPLLKMAADVPKSEPFAQNDSWSAQSANPLLKMTAGAPKV